MAKLAWKASPFHSLFHAFHPVSCCLPANNWPYRKRPMIRNAWNLFWDYNSWTFTIILPKELTFMVWEWKGGLCLWIGSESFHSVLSSPNHSSSKFDFRSLEVVWNANSCFRELSWQASLRLGIRWILVRISPERWAEKPSLQSGAEFLICLLTIWVTLSCFNSLCSKFRVIRNKWDNHRREWFQNWKVIYKEWPLS